MTEPNAIKPTEQMSESLRTLPSEFAVTRDYLMSLVAQADENGHLSLPAQLLAISSALAALEARIVLIELKSGTPSGGS